MNKKILIPIIIIFLIILGIGGYITYFDDDGSAVIGNSKISIPSTYKIIKTNEKETTINDGNTNITLTVYNNQTINDLVNDYIKSKDSKNQSVKSENMSLSGVDVVKTSLFDEETNTTFVNYWFEKEGIQYRFHSDIHNAQEKQLKTFEEDVTILINGTRKK